MFQMKGSLQLIHCHSHKGAGWGEQTGLPVLHGEKGRDRVTEVSLLKSAAGKRHRAPRGRVTQ